MMGRGGRPFYNCRINNHQSGLKYRSEGGQISVQGRDGYEVIDLEPKLPLPSDPVLLYNSQAIRGVAQLGRVLRSGRRGHGFKSRHPD